MIINIDSYRYYNNHPKPNSYVKQDFGWLEPLKADDNTYFYIEVLGSRSFEEHDTNEMIPPDILEAIHRNEIILAIANSGHGYHELVDNIYVNVILKHQIDPSNILLISESADIHLEVEAIAAKYNIGKCKLQWVNEFDYIINYNLHRNHKNKNINTLQDKEYQKKFLSWNGMFRPHRSAIVYLLECLDVLSKGYVSFNTKGGHPDHSIEWISHAMSYNEEFKEIMECNAEKLAALPGQIFIDDPLKYTAFEPGEASLYENTYFSLVTETSFPFIKFHYGIFENAITDVGRILSEKIFKPIGMKHPFIVVSNPKTLELLRTLGYKTFSPWIDESYDLIEDDAERLLAIAKETKRLCELNPQELTEFLINCKEICEYNLKVMQSKTIHDYRHNIIL
jgi:hypothetical protein